jgi:hypothetical protein
MKERKHMKPAVESAWWVLRVALGLGPLLAGADKFFNILTDWSMYLSPAAAALMSIEPATFMQTVGAIEMAVGVAILTFATRVGAWIAMAWLIGIAVTSRAQACFFELAVRDLEMAVAAYVLTRLTEVREAQLVRAPAGAVGTIFHGRASVMMRVLAMVGSFCFLMASGVAADTWSNVPLIEMMCATKAKENRLPMQSHGPRFA